MTARKIACVALIGLSLPSLPQLAEQSEGRELSRQEIREMPITARPSRPGHFYGNAVRRNKANRLR